MIMAATDRDNKNSGSASPECPICFETRTNQRPKSQKSDAKAAWSLPRALIGGEDRRGVAEGIAQLFAAAPRPRQRHLIVSEAL